ncbi:MAG TPA: YCF48-related protein [Thermoanaerobaculia bacterium]
MRKLLILLILVAAPLSAEWHRAKLFGADVRALIIDPSDPDTLYLGTSGGEVYVSHDGARTWTNPRISVEFPGHIVDNLVIDRDGRLWAACWGLWGGGVIAVSSDGGRTWSRRDEGLEDFSVRAIAIDPRDANFVVVGGLTGVYRSTSSGRTWEKISDQINVESLAIDPRTHDRIYVGTWRQGIRTDDGGKSWKLINGGMVLDTDMFAITIDPANPDDVWVATCGWVYNTINRGDLWTRYRDGFDNRRIHDVEVDPCDRTTVYAGSVAGLYRSHDRGKNWYRVSDESLVVNNIALHPQRPHRIVLGIEGDGIYVSDDDGKTFARSCDGLRNLTITSIAADPARPKRVYASVVFGGSSTGIYVSDDAAQTWRKLSTSPVPPVLSLVVTAEGFVAGTEKGFYLSADGTEWTQSAPVNRPLRVDKVLRYNAQRYFAATSEGVFTSKDGGKSWDRLADADSRTVDIALGFLGEKRALFALTSAGLQVFDGRQWWPIDGAPAKGGTLALRFDSGQQFVYVAGKAGVKGGIIDASRKWHDAEAPDAQFASVYSGNRSANEFVFLTSRQQRELLVSEPSQNEWRAFPLPSRTAEVTSIALDPFESDRLYVGTLGEGVFVFEGKSTKYEAAKTANAAVAGGATN